MRAPNGPLASRSSNAMPYDKPNPPNPRPLMPTISASAMKNINTIPLTPRIAGSNPSSSTPLVRRATRQDITPTPNSTQREGRSTPVSSFISNNITPRSGSRKSRVDSTNTTPTGTPTSTPACETFRIPTERSIGPAGLGIISLDSSQSRLMAAFSPGQLELDVSRDQIRNHPQSAGKFFYASDTKSTLTQSQPQRQIQHKQPTFLYANGETVLSTGGSTAALSPPNEEKVKAKFVHANGTPDITAGIPPAHSFGSTGSTVSSTSHITSPRLAPAVNCQPRPVSPTKLADQITYPNTRNINTAPSLILPQNLPHSGPISVNNTGLIGGHSKSPSIDRETSIVTRCLLEEDYAGSVSPSLPSSIISPIITSPTEQNGPQVVLDSGPTTSEVTSPMKAGHSLEHMNELAANARRERKVLDLEITNSSLAAINRTLEREMRKQTAELRRYRRLSRSGRLSIATGASRASTGSLLLSDIAEDVKASDASEDDGYDDPDDSSEIESIDDDSLSPSALAESDARHQKRDEERLQLDLSKHQQLLIDSQKMNQSLKRCLGWTEELINEGKKALAYRIHVSDVELGGRVLSLDDIEDNEDDVLVEEEFYGSSSDLGRPLRPEEAKSDGKEDRDSGIDLGLGPPGCPPSP
jgi:hypothetical protein